LPPSFKLKDNREREKERTDAEKWMKDRERLETAEKMAKDIADKYRKKKEEESPWATDKMQIEGVDVEDITKQIYGKLKKEEDFDKALRDGAKEKKTEAKDEKRRLEDLSESIGNKLREKWNSREKLRGRHDDHP